jgi:Pvc16 N-terminal domain
MSDSFAIAAVTASMAYILQKQGGITVTTRPPDAAAGGTARLNIFLYQVTPNLGYRNMDTPSRSYSGELVRKQQLGLDLHYLLTAYGNNDDELSAQKTLAEAMRVLHENPVFSRDLVELAINEWESDLADIDKSNITEQVELLKITMQSMSLEDLTKIWSSFFKTGSYRISVTYKATVVLLDGKKEPRSTMPVRNINSYVHASRAPEIIYIEPQMVPWISGGTEIKIVGRNLKADMIKIDFGEGLEADDMPEPTYVSADELVVAISDSIAPGIKQVRVLHPLSIGTPETPHRGLDSNVALFAIVPIITDVSPASVARGSKLSVKFEPAVNREQDVKVIISTYKPLEVEWPTGDTNTTTDTVLVTIPSDYVTNKDLPVRLRVDSAESQPDKKKWNNEFNRPAVKVIIT